MKKPRTRKDLRADPRVDKTFHEEDGWWVWLAPGWRESDNICHTIHENTIKLVCEQVARAVPCNCTDCQPTK